MSDYWNKWLEDFYCKIKDEKISLAKESNKMAVIVEPRKHPLLKYVVYNFSYMLQNKGWSVCIVHGTENEEFVKEECKEIENIYYYNLPYSNLNEKMYNYLLTNETFWETLPTTAEHLLIFQTDTVLLKSDLEEYLKYDFVGAPWKNNHPQGANGGFSLRTRSGMIRACKNVKFQYTNEDGYFTLNCGHLLNLPKRIDGYPDNEVKSRFSVETIYYEEPVGMHSPYKHLKENEVKTILQKAWKRMFKEEIKL